MGTINLKICLIIGMKLTCSDKENDFSSQCCEPIPSVHPPCDGTHVNPCILGK